MRNFLVLILFLLLTIILTYPLPQHMATKIVEPGDSLLNTWVFSWDIQKILSDPSNLFHANIFYPYKNTLAFTEHMVGNALLGMPVYLATKNPVLVYNFVLLATFIIGGWGMYLLLRYLTGSMFAGIIGGIIFVYNPYRFYELSHIHVLSIQWLPFTLLFLHKYFKDHRNKDLLLFCILFVLQAITSGHIGLYQNFIVCLFLLFIVISRENNWGIHWIKFIFAFAIVSLIIFPLYLPYIHLAKELNFVRPISELKKFSASIGHFRNILYPGFLALILAILGIFHSRNKEETRRPRYIILPINIIILITLAIIISIVTFGGFDTGHSVLGINLRFKSLENPFFILIGLLIIKYIIQKNSFQASRFYFILAVLSLLFCLGPEIKLKDTFDGPYLLLYNYFPGFKGLRVPLRWGAIYMFAVAALAGLGWKRLERWSWTRWTVFPVIIIVILYGYKPTPLRLDFTIGEKPSVYEWLKHQPDDTVIVELPMPERCKVFFRDAVYMYWSLYHNKRMINGYSGNFPPAYWQISELMQTFPSNDSIELLQYLGVNYIITHYEPEEEKLNGFNKDLTLRYKDGTDHVYELISSYQPVSGEKGKDVLVALDKSLLDGKANYNQELAGRAYDNNIDTRWTTGKPQTSGMWFQLDLGRIENIDRIILYLSKSANDYPRGLIVEVSEDGKNWKKIDIKFSHTGMIIDLMENPTQPKMILDFDTVPARYMRLSVNKDHPEFYWSIYEIDIFPVAKLIY